MRFAMFFLFAAGSSLPLFGQADAPWSVVGQVGALGVLCWALRYLLSTFIPEQRAAFAKSLRDITTRYDAWEQSRHDDSCALTEALEHLREHCAAVRDACRE